MITRLIIILIIIFNIILTQPVMAADLASQLSGRILLQTEQNGEAWYVNPANLKRYFLGRPADAYEVMRDLGVGITNSDLNKIQIADANLNTSKDTDGDGLSDMVEDAVGSNKNITDSDGDGYNDKDELLQGYNIAGEGELNFDDSFTLKHKGKIFLQIENNGEAWYVDSIKLKRYYLGRPSDAFNIMRSLGLGITDSNLENIVISDLYSTPILKIMEKNIQELINAERQKYELGTLKWNSELADVAREHSNSLAMENINLIKDNIRCDLPLIHHEGFDFGLYNQDRLKNRQVYYLSASAENIALIPGQGDFNYYYSKEQNQYEIQNCGNFFDIINTDLKTKLEKAKTEVEKKKIVNDEIVYRTDLVNKQSVIEIFNINEKTMSQIEKDAVVGWMNSPGHRANILTAEYDEAGVGIVEIKNYLIITQVFITRVECGYLEGSCCEKEGYYPTCYEPYNCVDLVCVE